jgi:RimJ/RimL family protein N-acetyltransferase
MRVVLEPLVAADAPELAGLLDVVGVPDVDALRERFARWETRRSPDGAETWLNWVIRDREDGRALGWAQATVRGSRASVAYAVLPDARGRGAASDAVRTLVPMLRERGVDEIRALIAPDNVASQHVVRAAGFVETDQRAYDGEVVWRAPCKG